MDLGEFE